MCACCSFFLQLSLVDFSCTGYPACISAAASLSLSLEAYSHTDCWPAILQNYSGIIQQVSTITLLCCAVAVAVAVAVVRVTMPSKLIAVHPLVSLMRSGPAAENCCARRILWWSSRTCGRLRRLLSWSTSGGYGDGSQSFSLSPSAKSILMHGRGHDRSCHIPQSCRPALQPKFRSFTAHFLSQGSRCLACTTTTLCWLSCALHALRLN